MYSVLAKREKGALGLLFEMNYFLGAALAIAIIYHIYAHGPPAEEKYLSLYNWLYY